ncbi:hypothetical protein T01_15686 [Trichinella spiralis]|uniref:Uncharacterized protein n=1 Tax=Trichinella spiralis TaxID=6334 RepID=A0A0V1BG89_TRISP|nr:hypothetical protein T01_15686 [Trichinella spiralis]
MRSNWKRMLLALLTNRDDHIRLMPTSIESAHWSRKIIRIRFSRFESVPHKQQIHCKANRGPAITISSFEKRNERKNNIHVSYKGFDLLRTYATVLYAWLPQRVDYVALVVVVMCLSY